MVNVNLLKSKIVEKGMTQAEFCKAIGMAQTTFIRKMKHLSGKEEPHERYLD